MKKLLIQLKEAYLKESMLGLCHPLYIGMIDSAKDSNVLIEYIGENTPELTAKHDPYCWKPGDKVPRIKWLDTHIELNS